MKKVFIIFLAFFILDIIMYIIFGSLSDGKNFVMYYLPIIFLEIAFFGCLILYEISKKGKK